MLMAEFNDSCIRLFRFNSITTSNSRIMSNKISKASSFILIACMVFFSAAAWSNNGILSLTKYVFAQEQSTQSDASLSTDKIQIDLNSATFAPLKDSSYNQLRILINYHTLDPLLVNSPMAGIMKVYDTQGALIKTSPIPKGWVLGQSGVMPFATSFADKTIQNVKAEVYMTDTLGNTISNVLPVQSTLTG